MNVKAEEPATTFLTNHKTKEDGGPLSHSAHFHAMQAREFTVGWACQFTLLYKKSSMTVTLRWNMHNMSSKTMRDIDWQTFRSVYMAQDIKIQAFITKFVYGWLPCGTRRRLIGQGTKDACPHCGMPKHNEHMPLCQDKRALYHLWHRVTAITSKIKRQAGGSAVTKVWIALLTHIMQGKQGAFIITCIPSTYSGNHKRKATRGGRSAKSPGGKAHTERLSEQEIERRNQQWFLTKPLLGQNGGKWASKAITLLWRATHSAWKARNDELHRGRHDDVAQSTQNERIWGIYKLQTEICNRDRHMFSVELETLLKSRKSKKRRFLVERADFILEASKKFAATGQTSKPTTILQPNRESWRGI